MSSRNRKNYDPDTVPESVIAPQVLAMYVVDGGLIANVVVEPALAVRPSGTSSQTV
jgi:hypothetical protein